jgi:hypothetical protein
MFFLAGLLSLIIGVLAVFWLRPREGENPHAMLRYPGVEAMVAIFISLLIVGGLMATAGGLIDLFG